MYYSYKTSSDFNIHMYSKTYSLLDKIIINNPMKALLDSDTYIIKLLLYVHCIPESR